MAILPIPMAGYLVPEHPRTAPEGFAVVDVALARGLPHTITLASDLRLTVTLATGLARAWRDADPATVVSDSSPERAPVAAHTPLPIADASRAPLHLLLQVGADIVASIPVVAGRRLLAPDAGDAARGARIELEVLSWCLVAGTVRAAGDYGSRIALAWRRADVAPLEFDAPAINPSLERRLAESGALAAANAPLPI